MSTTPPQPPPAEKTVPDQVIQQTGSGIKIASSAEPTDGVDLPTGKELSELNAVALATAQPVRWIVVAGHADSGKTTLLTCLYELFQWGSVEGYQFAGSNTLPAFEQRCHLSRMASERESADTQRTPYKGPIPTYLHLRVSPVGDPQDVVDFLFTDVSGEMFEHARDSTDECKELTFLRRAEAFLIVLDGENIVRLDKRWAIVEEAKSLLRSCLDSAMLSKDCIVNVVWSKRDYFVGAGDTEERNAFRQDVELGFRAAFERRVKRLQFSEIAARPLKAPTMGFGKGLAALLNGWIADSPSGRKMNLSPTPLGGSRESELFATRHASSTVAP